MVVLAADQCPSGIYTIANDISRPLREYADIIFSIFPNAPMPGHDTKNHPINPSLNPCISKILASTPWRKLFTFEQGIAELLQSLP